jgi:hypothetical protein
LLLPLPPPLPKYDFYESLLRVNAPHTAPASSSEKKFENEFFIFQYPFFFGCGPLPSL